uniref:Uncharacterized protein n=1 Tax=Steinernema glaseri TaxID=37863 RepID=A0A1I7Z113_9BILA
MSCRRSCHGGNVMNMRYYGSFKAPGTLFCRWIPLPNSFLLSLVPTPLQDPQHPGNDPPTLSSNLVTPVPAAFSTSNSIHPPQLSPPKRRPFQSTSPPSRQSQLTARLSRRPSN